MKKHLSDKPRTCKCGKTNQETVFKDTRNQCVKCYKELVQKYNKSRRVKQTTNQPFDWIWNNNI
jgi:hypothetical protein